MSLHQEPDLRHVGADALPKDVFAPSERDRILQAMAAACAERGYAEVRVEEVIERAGVTYEAFAANFASKEECGAAATSLAFSETVATIWAFEARSEPETVAGATRALVTLAAKRPALAYLMYVQARQCSSRRMREIHESGVLLAVALADRLPAATAAGRAFKPPSATRGVLGGAEALIRQELVAGRAEHLPSLIPDIVYAALVPFLGQDEALRQASQAREQLGDKS